MCIIIVIIIIIIIIINKNAVVYDLYIGMMIMTVIIIKNIIRPIIAGRSTFL